MQSGATHNEFDLYGDVIDPAAAFLRRHRRGPWAPGGAKAGDGGTHNRVEDCRWIDGTPKSCPDVGGCS